MIKILEEFATLPGIIFLMCGKDTFVPAYILATRADWDHEKSIFRHLTSKMIAVDYTSS